MLCRHNLVSCCLAAIFPIYNTGFSLSGLVPNHRQTTLHEMTAKACNEYTLRPYNPDTDRDTLNEICANVYGGGDYLPKVAETYVADPLCSFLGLAGIQDNTAQKNEIVAVANYKRLPLQNSAWIEAVRTHPKHQNRGLASSLLRELIALSKEEDVNRRILTCTIESNKGMQRALEKVGFERYGTIPALSFDKLKELPGWSAECTAAPMPLLSALKLDDLVSDEVKSVAISDNWRTVVSESELLMALEECQQSGGTCGYLPGLYEYIVPSPSRTDLQQSIKHGLVFTLNISDKDISRCDSDCITSIQADKAILAFTKDDRISSLKSQWVCSIVAYTRLAFEAALVYAHSTEVAKRMHKLESNAMENHAKVDDDESKNAKPFCLVFDDAVPLEHGTLAHALPRVTDKCVVFSYMHT